MFGAMRFGYGFLIAILCPTGLATTHSQINETTNDSSQITAPVALQCEARTINYITHGLPQSCFTSPWVNPTATVFNSSSTTGPEHGSDTTVASPGASDPTTTLSAEEVAPTASLDEGTPARFMSFEDWKELMMRESGQDPSEPHRRKSREHGGADRSGPDVANYGLGDEDEIALDFGTFVRDNERDTPKDTIEAAVSVSTDQDETAVTQGSRVSPHRSKDAGKTCKERFSFSSFDAGATVLKTGPATKNAKAILVENKDTYMLLECATKNKFVIVELSDDIEIDTIVLANFEFFSSMIRHFRVSVSDRYPVKMEKWRDLGTFEARNSRDIQPFLIENPQTWAKYVRIEFLTNYGNEFYCPISLLRVHGSSMLDSWKDSREDDGLDEDETGILDVPDQDNRDTTALDHESENVETEFEPRTSTVGSETCSNPRLSLFDLFRACGEICVGDTPRSKDILMGPLSHNSTQASEHEKGDLKLSASVTTISSAFLSDTEYDQSTVSTSLPPPASISYPPNATTGASRDQSIASVDLTTSTLSASTEVAGNASTSSSKVATPSTTTGKSRTSGTNGPSAASPTGQEGFFNAITKRLQQVESNLTLSLKYIEDQSRQMQDALRGAEHKQSVTVSDFLDSLNQTVLAELRSVRDQYDQIWQSTVIALDTQREKSEHDIVALGTRLNLLADEVVFQKRMAIVQAVLLLSCLFLVIFSRGVPIPSIGSFSEVSAGVRPYSVPIDPSPIYHNLEATKQHVPREQLIAGHVTDGNRDQLAPADGENPLQGHFELSDEVPAVQVTDFETNPEYGHLSPPSSPVLSAIELGHPAGSHEATTLFRRVSSAHQGQTRKPLPALPEHPASP